MARARDPIDQVLGWLGAAGLLATAGIHLDLYLTGYRFIPTIGDLFVVQAVAGLSLGVGVALSRRPLLEAAAALFAAATLGGWLLSLWVGMFGFHEVRTTAGIVAGGIEAATIGVLAMASLRGSQAIGLLRNVRPIMVAALGPAALLAVGIAASVSSGAPAASGTRSTTGLSSGAPASSQAGSPESASKAHVTIIIKNFAFSPQHVTVKPGERILVHNEDGVTHTFTALPGSSPRGHFNSGDIAPGRTATVTAPVRPGTYSFYCEIHPFMTGTLVVRA